MRTCSLLKGGGDVTIGRLLLFFISFLLTLLFYLLTLRFSYFTLLYFTYFLRAYFFLLYFAECGLVLLLILVNIFLVLQRLYSLLVGSFDSPLFSLSVGSFDRPLFYSSTSQLFYAFQLYPILLLS